MKKKIFVPILIILAIVFGLCVGGYLYIHSPKYTLSVIKSSIENHDWEKFNKWVDIESFFNSTLNDKTNTGNNIADGISKLMASNLKGAFIDALKAKIETPSNSSISAFNEFLPAIKIKDLSEVKLIKQGKITVMKIPVKTDFLKQEAEVSVFFRNKFLRYVLIGTDDSDFQTKNNELKKLVLEHYNLETGDKIKKSVTISTLKKYKGCSNYIGNTCFQDLLIIKRKIHNHSNKTIKKLRYNIYPSKTFVTMGDKYRIYETLENVSANSAKVQGASTGWKHNQFSTKDQMFMSSKKGEIFYEIKEIEFDDSTKLTLKSHALLTDYHDEKPTFDDIIKRRKKHGLQVEELLNKYQ